MTAAIIPFVPRAPIIDIFGRTFSSEAERDAEIGEELAWELKYATTVRCPVRTCAAPAHVPCRTIYTHMRRRAAWRELNWINRAILAALDELRGARKQQQQ